MSYIFRGIGNKTWWYKDRSDFPWLGEGELIADIFKGLNATHGSLSVYAVDSDQTYLNRIIAALACTRNSIQNFDYVLVPVSIIEENFELQETKGNTADDKVNEWHWNIIHLTSSKLNELAYIVRDHRESMSRLPEKKVESAVRQGIDDQFIDFNRIRDSLKEKFT